MSYDHDAVVAGEAFADTFSKFLNNFNRTPQKHAVAKMLRDHRSLQQSTMRFFMLFVEGLSQGGSDGRNEAAVELAKKIMALPERDRVLPFI